LIILSFASHSGQFKHIQYEILSSARDGNFYGWAIQHNLNFSHKLDPDNFIGMTDGELEEILLNLCGAKSSTINRPVFNNHIEIINGYKIIENDKQYSFSIKDLFPITESHNRRLQIGLKVINPLNDRINVALVKHNKLDNISWTNLKDRLDVDLKEKGIIHYISIDITGLKTCESVSLYADGVLIQTVKPFPEYIDLGFGPKWATCNLGATRPTECGYYFAWGESRPKTCFNTVDNYCNESDISGIETYDAATVIRGKNWRIPKKKEWDELYRKCDTEFITIDGIQCIKFKSSINKKSIILPLTGYMIRTRVDNFFSNFGRCYWSSTQYDQDSAFDNIGRIDNKYLGHMIRPVYNEDK
jgi:hypothetical protein